MATVQRLKEFRSIPPPGRLTYIMMNPDVDYIYYVLSNNLEEDFDSLKLRIGVELHNIQKRVFLNSENESTISDLVQKLSNRGVEFESVTLNSIRISLDKLLLTLK